MKHHFSDSNQPRFRQVALWKWIVILLLVVAMPLFFSYYRMMRLQQIMVPVHQGTTTQQSDTSH